ncbi:hypothetical protein VARIO8X_60445 [Burkholderiales bacterium 8X]|nr:hypothetical protein VARIO8X_60445 [Burkholderiales bacterium 8X]
MIHGDDDLDVAQLRANDVVQASISKAMTGLHEGSNWKLLKDTLFEEVAAEYKWPICLSIAKLELIAICIQLVGKKSTHGDKLVHDLIKLKPRVDENVDGKEFVKAQRGVLKRLARTIEKILSRSQHRVQLSLGADAICGEAIFAADIQADIDKLRQKRRVKASSVEAYAGKVVAHVPHMTGAALAECLQAFKPTAKGVVLQCQILLTAFEAKEMPIAPVLSYWLLMVGLAR